MTVHFSVPTNPSRPTGEVSSYTPLSWCSRWSTIKDCLNSPSCLCHRSPPSSVRDCLQCIVTATGDHSELLSEYVMTVQSQITGKFCFFFFCARCLFMICCLHSLCVELWEWPFNDKYFSTDIGSQRDRVAPVIYGLEHHRDPSLFNLLDEWPKLWDNTIPS